MITDLGTLGGTVSEALALNERSQVVGWSELEAGRSRRHAFLWENAKLRDLGTLGRDLGGDMPSLSQAVAINARGQILGNSSVDQNTPVSYAFVWQNGRMTAVTSAGGGKNSYASAINERGQVVGWSGYDYGFLRGHAFLWQSGKTRDLGTLPGEATVGRTRSTSAAKSSETAMQSTINGAASKSGCTPSCGRREE